MILHAGFLGFFNTPFLQYFVTIIYFVYTFYIRYNVMGFFGFQIFPNISMQWNLPIYIQLIITSYANKIIFQWIFGVFWISKSFQLTPSDSASNNFCKKNMQSNFSKKNRICCIMLYARFLPNFGRRFCKMDIFLFFKNVQNQKPPTNLERPFFWDSKFGIYAVYLHTHINIFIMILWVILLFIILCKK